MKTIRKIATFASICILVGCAGPQALVDSPIVRLSSIKSAHMSFDRQNFLLGFEVSNPNAFPLPVKVVKYSVRINDQRFASGETQGEFTIPAHGDGAFTISVDLDMLQQTSRLASLLRLGSHGDLAYELEGSFAVNIPFARPIPFSSKGTLSLAEDL
ncbi:MAG: LEA type 2 family protein [Gammaproteobacteria bacterium]|nr:LEA type 2 family protein [Gammaproteobacteria bacterium]